MKLFMAQLIAIVCFWETSTEYLHYPIDSIGSTTYIVYIC